MSTPIMREDIRQYLDELVPAWHPEIAAMEQYAREHNFPIIGPASGQFCYLMARLIGARQIFELGSGYGYSTAWFAKAVEENGGGEVHHVVWDEALSQQAQKHLAAMDLERHVVFHVGEAVERLETRAGPFDLIFNDIDKEMYPRSLPVIEDKLRPGGVMIIDNMLWHGAILDANDTSAATEGVREFTHRVTRSESWISSLVPIRDGLIAAMKLD